MLIRVSVPPSSASRPFNHCRYTGMSMTGLVNDHASAYPRGGGTRVSAGTAVIHHGSAAGSCSTSVPGSIRTPASPSASSANAA